MCRTAHALLQTVICGIQMLVRVFMTIILMFENLVRMILQTLYNFISFMLQMISLIPICVVFLLTARLKCFMCGGGGPCPANRGGACDCLMSALAIMILFFIFRATGVLDKIFYKIGYSKTRVSAEKFLPTPGEITECSRETTSAANETNTTDSSIDSSTDSSLTDTTGTTTTTTTATITTTTTTTTKPTDDEPTSTSSTGTATDDSMTKEPPTIPPTTPPTAPPTTPPTTHPTTHPTTPPTAPPTTPTTTPGERFLLRERDKELVHYENNESEDQEDNKKATINGEERNSDEDDPGTETQTIAADLTTILYYLV